MLRSLTRSPATNYVLRFRGVEPYSFADLLQKADDSSIGDYCLKFKGSPFITRKLEVEDDAGRNAQVLLRLRGGASCCEARQEVIHLDGTNGEMFRQFDVKAATCRHGKASVRSICRGSTCAHAFCAEEHLAKGRDAVPVAVRNPRTKKISGQREVQASVQNVAVMISAEIGDATQPVIHIVRNGSAAAVEIEILCPIPPIKGIPGKDIHFGMILGLGHPGQQREKRKQRHHELTLHYILLMDLCTAEFLRRCVAAALGR